MSARTYTLIHFIGTLLLVFVIAPEASAQSRLKVSHQWAESDLRHQMFLEFEKRVTAKLGNALQFQAYPAGSLIKPRQQWEALRRGRIDLSIFSLVYASGKVPALDIVLMPGLIRNTSEGMSWRTKPIGEKIEQILEQNDIKLLVWWWGNGGIGSTKKPVKLPKDVKGLQFRAAGSVFEHMLLEAGASITSMSSTEIYYALSTGVLDSCMTTSTSLVSYRLYEKLKFVNLPKNYSIFHTLTPLLMSKQAWESLSSQQQAALEKVAEDMYVDWIPAAFDRSTEDVIRSFSRPGIEIHYMNESEFVKWRNFAIGTAWERFKTTAPEGEELLELALQAFE